MDRTPRNSSCIRALLCILGCVCSHSARAEQKGKLPPPAQVKISFTRHIRPILAQRCFGCHGPKKQEGSLRLDNRSSLLKGGDSEKPAIVVGKSAKSRLIQLTAGLDPDTVMPPEGARLTAGQISLLRAWIDQGAQGLPARATRTTNHWSFQPIRRPRLPRVTDARIRSPIDTFILRKLREKKLDLSAAAGRAQLIRRLFLDLLGLLPTPEQTAAFLADSAPDAYERLVDRVLANPRYGERWAQHWLDIVRFADTNGFETNTPRPNAYHYRDYVIRAFNTDRPYDQFVMDQLAGDQSGQDVATGFLVAGAYDRVKSPDINLTLMQRQDELADMINATSTAFLAMTVACARCHNHKFDPILQTDFYGMQAIFAGVRHGNRRLASTERGKQALEAQRRIAAEIKLQKGLLYQLTKRIPAQSCLVIDDQLGVRSGQFVHLRKPTGRPPYPSGNQAGARDDPGSAGRLPNLGRGSYTYWVAEAAANVAAYRPQLTGKHRIWLTWSCYPTHSRRVQYVLDRDGNPKTKADQKVIATVDQRRWVGSHMQAKTKPSFSGLYDAGVHELNETTQLLIRATDSAPTTAETVIFQQLKDPAQKTLPLIGQLISSQTNEERFAPVRAKYLRFTILATNSSEPCIDELEVFQANSKTNIALAKAGTKVKSSGDFPNNALHKLKHINDGIFGNSKSWISNQVGRGWVEMEFADEQLIDRVRWGRDKQSRFKDRTATEYLIQVATTPGQWRTVATAADHFPLGYNLAVARMARFNALPKSLIRPALAQAKSLSELESELARHKPSTMNFAYAGTFVQPGPTHRLHRGDPLQKREEVAPAAISILGQLAASKKSPERVRRVALARWMTSKNNPLTARVIVNRLWHHHFGVGVVRTPSDFGANGAQPTHPELLDYLASELQDFGWSLKRLHRLIVLSATYRQQSKPKPQAMAIDAGTRLLWRFPPRRLTAEVIRDNVLQVSGVLDLSMYGPGYSVFKPNTNYVRVYTPKDRWGPGEWRRMVYMHKVRMERDDVFGAFDCPDAGQPTARRSRSTTAIQALSLLNSQFMIQQARLFTERVKREVGMKPADQIRRAFSLCFGRRPSQVEANAANQLIKQHGLFALCRALLNSNELLFLP